MANGIIKANMCLFANKMEFPYAWVQEIFEDTPAYMVGHEITDYASVFVCQLVIGDTHHTLNAVFDTENDVRALVIADYNDIIINKED